MRAVLSSVTESVIADVTQREAAPKVAAIGQESPFSVPCTRPLVQLHRVKHQRLRVEKQETPQQRAGQAVEIAHRQRQRQGEWNNEDLQRPGHLQQQQRQWQRFLRQHPMQRQQQQGTTAQRVQENQKREQQENCRVQQHNGEGLRCQQGRTVRGSGVRFADLYPRMSDAYVIRSSLVWPQARVSTRFIVPRLEQRTNCAARILLLPLMLLIPPYLFLSGRAGSTIGSSVHSCWCLNTQRARQPAVRVILVAGLASRATTAGGQAAATIERQAGGPRTAEKVCKAGKVKAAAAALLRGLAAARGSEVVETHRAAAAVAGRTSRGATATTRRATLVTPVTSSDVAPVGPPMVGTARKPRKTAGASGRAAERAAIGLVAPAAALLVAFLGTHSSPILGRDSSLSPSRRSFPTTLFYRHSSRAGQRPAVSLCTPLSPTSSPSTVCLHRAVPCTASSCISSPTSISLVPSSPSCFAASLNSPPASGSVSTAVRLPAPSFSSFVPCCATYLSRSLVRCCYTPSPSFSVFSVPTPASTSLEFPRAGRRKLQFRTTSATAARPSLQSAHYSPPFPRTLFRCHASFTPRVVSLHSRFIFNAGRFVPRLPSSGSTAPSARSIVFSSPNKSSVNLRLFSASSRAPSRLFRCCSCLCILPVFFTQAQAISGLSNPACQPSSSSRLCPLPSYTFTSCTLVSPLSVFGRLHRTHATLPWNKHDVCARVSSALMSGQVIRSRLPSPHVCRPSLPTPLRFFPVYARIPFGFLFPPALASEGHSLGAQCLPLRVGRPWARSLPSPCLDLQIGNSMTVLSIYCKKLFVPFLAVSPARYRCRTPVSLGLLPHYSSLLSFSHTSSTLLTSLSTCSAQSAALRRSLRSATPPSLPPVRSFSDLPSSSALSPSPPSGTSCVRSSFVCSLPQGVSVSRRASSPVAPSFHSHLLLFSLEGASPPSILSSFALTPSAARPSQTAFLRPASTASFPYFSPFRRTCFITSSLSAALLSFSGYGVLRHLPPLASRSLSENKHLSSLFPVSHRCQQSSAVRTHLPLFCCSRVICTVNISESAAERGDDITADTAAAPTCLPVLMSPPSFHISRHFTMPGLLLIGQRRVSMPLLQTTSIAAAGEAPASTSTPFDTPAKPRDLFTYMIYSNTSTAFDTFSLRGGRGGEQEGDSQNQGPNSVAPTTREDAPRKPIAEHKKEAFVDHADDGQVKGETAALKVEAHELKGAKRNPAARASVPRNSITEANTCRVKEPTARSTAAHHNKGTALTAATPFGTSKTPCSEKATEAKSEAFSADGDKGASCLLFRTTPASLSASYRKSSTDQSQLRLNPPFLNRPNIGEQRRLDRRLNWFKQYPYAPEAPAVRKKKEGTKTSDPSSQGVFAVNSFLPARQLPHSLRWELLAKTPAPPAAAAAAAAAATQAAADVLESTAVSVKQRKSKKRLKKRAVARAAVAAAVAAQKAPGSAALIAAARWLHSAQLHKTSSVENASAAGSATPALSAKTAAVSGCVAERGSETSTSGASSASSAIAAGTAAAPIAIERNVKGEEWAAKGWIHPTAREGKAKKVTRSADHASFIEGSLPGQRGEAGAADVAAGGSENASSTPQLTDIARPDRQHCPSLLSLLYPSKHATYPPQLAFFVMKQLVTSKFNESVELHVQLNMGGGPGGKPGMSGATVGRVKGYVTLPHGEFGELAQLAGSQQRHRQQESEQTSMQVNRGEDRTEERAILYRQEQIRMEQSDTGIQQKRRKSATDAEISRDQGQQPPHLCEEPRRVRQQLVKGSMQADEQKEHWDLGEQTQKARSPLPVPGQSSFALAAGAMLPDALIKEESGVVRGRKKGGLWRRRRVIAAFVDRADERAATQAGADIVGADKILSLIRDDAINFDVLISTPDMVARLTRYGKILGPKDLLPQDAWGTLDADFCGAIRLYRQTTVPYKSDKFNIVHLTIGHSLMSTDHLIENLEAAIHSLHCCRPPSAGPSFLHKVHISSTMGPGILLDMKHVRLIAGLKQRMR